jgi:hypothetical protein
MMVNKGNGKEMQEQYVNEKYNNQSLMEAYPYTALQSDLESGSEEEPGDQLKAFQDGMHYTREQALDSYREGTVESRTKDKER